LVKNMLTQERVKEALHYDRASGVFTWIACNSRNVTLGDVAGTLTTKGYIHTTIDGKIYQAHRLAYLYIKGYFPEYLVDHIKGITNDNRWVNLRHATQACNLQNQKLSSSSTSSFVGVSWNKAAKKWTSQIKINSKSIYLGSYRDPISAALVRCEYEKCCPCWHCNNQERKSICTSTSRS
jgi:hypothetical protein